jgi:hypothetical protein
VRRIMLDHLSSLNAKQPPGAQLREPRGPSPKEDRPSERATEPERSLPGRRLRPNMRVVSGDGGAVRTVHHVFAYDLGLLSALATRMSAR